MATFVAARWASCPLELGEWRALFLRFALDWPDALITARDGVTDRAVRYRGEPGVGKLATWLNGRACIDGYDELEAAA